MSKTGRDPPSASKIRVMLADDHAVLRAGLKLLINAEPDMEVVGEASNTEETLRVAQQTLPDVAVLDLSMPGGGLKAVERLPKACPNTRILVLTMHDDPAYLRNALGAGAAGYVVKKVADTELLSSVRAVHHGATIAFVGPAQRSQVGVGLGGRPGPETLHPPLSERERQVLVLLARGHTNRAIAARLGISIKSSETYRARLARKLGLRNRAQITSYALVTGLMDTDGGPDTLPENGTTG